MTARRRLLLHVGQTKAGSTSIQNYLEAEREALLAKGVLFPLTVFERQNPFDQLRTAGHLKFVKMLKAGDLEEFEAELARHPAHRLALTMENLFSDRPDETLARIGAYFRDWEVDLVAVVRPQFDWLRSRYVEYILSGFYSCDMSFDQFVRDVRQGGALDYAGRLRRLRKLLGARSVSAVAFDGDGGLVVRFLEAAGLPVTDPDRAASIRDNVREKPEFLIEAKRRLNSFTTRLHMKARLEIEHRLRNEAARMIAADPPLAAPSALAASLDAEEIATLKASNRSLAEMHGLNHPLPLGDPAGASASPAPTVAEATEALFVKGLEIAAGLAEAQRQADPAPADSILDLAADDLAALTRALAHHPVSLHVASPESAILAASLGGRIAVLALRRGRASYRVMSRLDRLATASPLLSLDAPHEGDWTTETLGDLLDRASVPRPGVIVLGPGAELSCLDAISHWREGHVLVVAIGDAPSAGSPTEERACRLRIFAIDMTAHPDGGALPSRPTQDA